MSAKPPNPKFVLRGSKDPITSLCFVNQEESLEPVQILATGNQKGLISLWNLKTKTKILEWAMESFHSSILWEHFSSQTLYSCCRSNSVTAWDLGNGSYQSIQKFSLGEYIGFSQCDLIDLKKNSLLATPGPSQEMVTIWEVKSGLKVCSIQPPQDGVNYGSVMQIKWIKPIPRLLVMYESGDMCLFDWSNACLVSHISIKENPLCIFYNDHLRRCICGTTTENLFSLELASNELLKVHSQFSIINPGISCITGRDDNKLFATGGWDHKIRIFSWKKSKPLAVLDYHKQSIECIDYSKGPVELMTSGFLLAAGSSDHTVSLWDIYN